FPTQNSGCSQTAKCPPCRVCCSRSVWDTRVLRNSAGLYSATGAGAQQRKHNTLSRVSDAQTWYSAENQIFSLIFAFQIGRYVSTLGRLLRKTSRTDEVS